MAITAMSSPISSDPLPLTFGIEVEHILAFHSSILTPHLPAGTAIIKDLALSIRLNLRQTTSQYLLTRPQYNGWALTAPTDYPSPFGSGWHNKCLEVHGCRGYADEILRMEQAILKAQGKDVTVHDGQGKMQDFSTWHLTTDTSLVGATPAQLASVIIEIDSAEWDSAPLELVSPPLALDDPASFAEIEAILGIIRGGEEERKLYKAFTDPYCGLHVHIGLPPSSSSERHFRLGLLQHLAYITVIYEHVLSELHPASRRPGHAFASTDLASNRDMFYEEPDYAGVDWDAVVWKAHLTSYISRFLKGKKWLTQPIGLRVRERRIIVRPPPRLPHHRRQITVTTADRCGSLTRRSRVRFADAETSLRPHLRARPIAAGVVQTHVLRG